LGIQQSIWTYCSSWGQTLALDTARTWPVHYGSAHCTPSGYCGSTSRSPMLPTLSPSYNIGWHHQQRRYTFSRVGNKPKILPALATTSYVTISQPSTA
jgi:hypothetical protein